MRGVWGGITVDTFEFVPSKAISYLVALNGQLAQR